MSTEGKLKEMVEGNFTLSPEIQQANFLGEIAIQLVKINQNLEHLVSALEGIERKDSR